MRQLLCLFAALFISMLTACGQTIKIISVAPSELKAYNKETTNDNGIRTLNVKLSLAGRQRGNISFPLNINAGDISSKPKLVDSVIQINSMAVPGISFLHKRRGSREVFYPVRVQLAPLTCLQNDESFQIFVKTVKEPVDSQRIIIHHFTIVPEAPTITLKEDSSILAPFVKTESSNGFRSVIVNVVLSGKKRLDRDTVLRFSIPPYVRSTSSPTIRNMVSFTFPKDSFPHNGCPVTLKIPLLVQLDQSTNVGEERVPILLMGDNANAHLLIIRPEVNPVTQSKKIDSCKKCIRFTHSCLRRIYTVTLKPDNLGGQVEVTEGDAQRRHVYQYSNFFHTGDFAQWFFTSLTPTTSGPCNDCATCINYITERVYEELLAAKKPAVGEKTLTDAKAIVAAKADTMNKEDEKNKETASTAAEVKLSVPDTISFKSNLSYGDTSLFSLEINRLKTKTDLKVCKDPKKGKDSCNSFSTAGDLTNESFDRIIREMLQKFTGEDAVDISKISPALAEQFSNYSKVVADKNPKEKTDAEKQAIAVLNSDTLTQTRVGVLYLKDSLVAVYDAVGRLVKKTKVDSVMFTIESGKLSRRQLFVETKDGTFTNKTAPISVLRLNQRGGDSLWNDEVRGNTFIYLKDVLKYRPFGAYFPDDLENGVVSPQKPIKVLSAASNLNSLINFSIYTDLPGLLGRKANGLINTDVTGRFITNTGNVMNRDVTPLSFIEANLSLSKFDSRFKSLDSTDIRANSTNHLDTLDRLKLVQTAWLKGSLKWNLFSWRALSSQYVEINVGARVNVVNVDSFYQKNTDIIFFDYYPELLYSVKRLSNFGMDLSLRWIFQYLSGKEHFYNARPRYIFSPQVAFYYFPANNSNNRLYLRFCYFAGHDILSKNFYQLQFGYKTSLKLTK